jgi:cysteine-rich repeat protein
LGTRDYYGNCNSDCGCAPDTFSYTCVPGQCGACPNNCDDANPNTVDTCDLVTCTCKHITQSFCGDGICNDGAGKTCDPDGTSMDVSCINVGGKLTEGVCRKTGTNACTYCGDGIVQSGDLEGCDLGDQNGVPGSSCASDCRPIELPVCGDSICNDGPGKTCELNGPAYDFKCPGGPQFRLNEGVCRSSGSNACTYCGDSIVQNNGLEECDLGDQNGIPGSGCTSECLTEPIIPEFSVFTLLLTIIISLFVFRFWII